MPTRNLCALGQAVNESIGRPGCHFFPTQYNTDVLRMNNRLLLGVGEARKISLRAAGSEFSATTSSIGPGLMTIVVPASFRKYARPLAAIGEPLYLPPSRSFQ